MHYNSVSRFFHWFTVLLVLVMIPVGFLMIQEIPRPVQNGLFALHKSLGPLVLVVVLLRLAWRMTHRPPPLPADLPRVQRRLAALVHAGLYLALIVMAVSGYVRVTTGGYPIEAFDALGIPALFSKDEAVSKVAESIHGTTIFVLLALVAMHVGAAAWHGLIRRDGIVGRMWPPL